MPHDDLFAFLAAGLTPFHTVAEVSRVLQSRKFTERMLTNVWESPLEPFYVVHPDGAIIAYAPGVRPLTEGCITFAAHTDSPSYVAKLSGARWKKRLLMLPTETYGSPIAATWFDRELRLAGQVVSATGDHHLFALPAALAFPNLALHLNRTANETLSYNAQDHLVAALDVNSDAPDGSAAAELMELVIRQCPGHTTEDVIQAQLAVAAVPALLGSRDSLFLAPRIDNLVGCYTSLHGFLSSSSERARILVLYAHEEIGSQTGPGAQGPFLHSFMERVGKLSGCDEESLAAMRERSRILSNDAAHAMHPSFAEKYDEDYSPIMGGGPVVKLSGTHRYATTARTEAEFRRACRTARVPVQQQKNRSDIRSGSTVGPITWARTGIQTVDVGVAILAMHSAVETASVVDTEQLVAALAAFDHD